MCRPTLSLGQCVAVAAVGGSKDHNAISLLSHLEKRRGKKSIDQHKQQHKKKSGKAAKPLTCSLFSALVREPVHSWHGVHATASSSGWDEENNQNAIIHSQRAAITSLLFRRRPSTFPSALWLFIVPPHAKHEPRTLRLITVVIGSMLLLQSRDRCKGSAEALGCSEVLGKSWQLSITHWNEKGKKSPITH